MRLASGNIQTERSVLPEGALQATDATVKKMMEVAQSQYGMRSPKIRALAINIVRKAGVREKDYYGEIVAIHKWVQKNIRYVKDPVNQETLSYPEELAFNSKAGDCDDMTILEIALLGSLGHKAWPVIMGVHPGIPSHVYLRAQVPPGKHRMAGRVIDLDPIMKNWPAGKSAPKHKVKIEHDYRDGNYSSGLQRQEGSNMNGLNDDLGSAANMLPGMGDYVTAPSYLDTEDSQVKRLLKPDLSETTNSVANTAKVSMAMEGIDGMFGGMGAEVVEDLSDPTPMQDRNSLDQLGPKGPMTTLAAKEATDALPGPKNVPIGAKVYEAPTLAKALANSRGKNTAQVRCAKKIVNVSANKGPVATAPKTPREEANEIEGLAGEVRTVTASFLPGLGLMGEEDAQEAAETSAIMSWWANLKAKAAAARAGWAEERARLAMAKAAPAVAQAEREAAAQEKANAEKAVRCAEEAGTVSQAMARKDPALAQVIAETQVALDHKAEEAASVDGLLGIGSEELGKAAANLGRRVYAGQGRRAVPMHSEAAAPNLSMAQRELVVLQNRRRILDQKIARLRQIARSARPAVRKAMRKNAGPRIMAPIQPTAMRVPEQRGRTSMTRRNFRTAPRRGWMGFRRGSFPMNGMGEEQAGMSSKNILLLLGLGAGSMFLLKSRKTNKK
ncbi:MAG: transglutaminase domain-containing protein [Okeania sp. SIO3H1]|nr:transglutaminase domain-containing protein [Okeania sp. SIO3H1]